jgi:hypothetical protein
MAINPVLRAQLADTLAALEELGKPVDSEWFLKRLIVEGPALGLPARSPGQWLALFTVYLDNCAKLSQEAVTSAFERWHANEMYPAEPGRHGFFPHPNELNFLGQKAMNDNLNAVFRARRALAYTEKLPPPKPTEEDRAKVREMMAEFRGTKPMPEEPVKLANTRHEAAERLRRIADRPSDEGEELV